MALDILEKKQLETQIRHLKELYPENLDFHILKQLQINMEKSNQELPYMIREVLDLFKKDENKLNDFLLKYGIHKEEKISIDETKQEIKHALNMSEITDFTRNGKTYIKITYEDGSIKMIEHRHNKDTKQIFEDIQKIKHLNSLSGNENAQAIFQELLKDYIEIPFEDMMFKNQDKLEEQEQSKLQFVQMSFPGKKVFTSFDENLFMIEGNPNMTVEVIESDGHYKIRPMKETSYGVTQENEIERKPYSIEELQRITEGMTEEEITLYFRMHGKNPGEIMMILLSLEEAKTKKKEPTLEKPKQMVLKKNRTEKMAAFINTLTLAFLVGMISGCIFFAMLGFILHALY